ncbi:MAG: hypothetical protein QMB62_07245 [Oscillospiraceae bacterium]
MCLIKTSKRSGKNNSASKSRSSNKHTRVVSRRTKRKAARKDYLFEDPSIRGEAHSLWEAEDIYDEDDFKDC